jgi:hypothetical protein
VAGKVAGKVAAAARKISTGVKYGQVKILTSENIDR